MFWYRFAAASALAAGLCAGAQADDDAASRWSFGLTGGTLGAGVEARYAVTERLALRAGGVSLRVDIDEVVVDDISYEGDIDLNAFEGMADYHVFGNSWHVTGGIMIGAPTLEAFATPQTVVEIGDVLYTPEEVGRLEADAELNEVAPVVGFGWNSAQRGRTGMTFSAFAGLAFYGSSNVALKAEDGLLAEDEAFLESLEIEEEILEDELEDFETYPIARLSVGYRF